MSTPPNPETPVALLILLKPSLSGGSTARAQGVERGAWRGGTPADRTGGHRYRGFTQGS